MKKIEDRMTDVRIEVVTTTFVASGQPVGIHNLDRFIEALNNPQISHQIELIDPAVRPLYRASDQLHLGASLLIRREEIVFANFEGPASGAATSTEIDAPVLLLAPPFQIQGLVSLAPGTEPTATPWARASRSSSTAPPSRWRRRPISTSMSRAKYGRRT